MTSLRIYVGLNDFLSSDFPGTTLLPINSVANSPGAIKSPMIDPFETFGYEFKLPDTGHWQSSIIDP